jgi:hypothetical protein
LRHCPKKVRQDPKRVRYRLNYLRPGPVIPQRLSTQQEEPGELVEIPGEVVEMPPETQQIRPEQQAIPQK